MALANTWNLFFSSSHPNLAHDYELKQKNENI